MKQTRNQSQIFNRKSISRNTTHRQSLHLIQNLNCLACFTCGVKLLEYRNVQVWIIAKTWQQNPDGCPQKPILELLIVFSIHRQSSTHNYCGTSNMEGTGPYVHSLVIYSIGWVALISVPQWRSEAKCRPGPIIKLPPFSPLKFASKN